MTHYLQIYILEWENDIKSSSYHPKEKRKKEIVKHGKNIKNV